MAKGKHAPAKGAIRDDKVLHPKSRKIAKQRTKEQRKLKLSNKSKAGGVRLQILGEKLLWFQDSVRSLLELKDSDDCIRAEDVHALANEYMARFDHELAQIKLKNSVGNRNRKQHVSRLDAIELAQKTERQEFTTCGLEMPDLLEKDSLEQLLAWNGELRYVQNFKMKKFSDNYLQSLSSSALVQSERMTVD